MIKQVFDLYIFCYSEIESRLMDREAFCLSVQRKQAEDGTEIVKLRYTVRYGYGLHGTEDGTEVV